MRWVRLRLRLVVRIRLIDSLIRRDIAMTFVI